MTAKLILMGDGRAVYVPSELLTPSTAEMIQREFTRFSGDLASVTLIMGEPVEVIDNRPTEPRTVAEVQLQSP
jgi:hypothetical protein